MHPPRRARIGRAIAAALTLLPLLWAGQHSGPGTVDLAAVQENGCSVTAGNGKVVRQPSAKCPVDIKLGNVLITNGGSAYGLAPGDTAWRPIDVSNIGNTSVEGLTLKVQPTASSLAASLRISVRRCSAPWTLGASGAYICSGTPSVILNGGSATQSALNLAPTPSSAKNGVDRLLVGVTLLTTAGNALQGASTAITYTFTASRT